MLERRLSIAVGRACATFPTPLGSATQGAIRTLGKRRGTGARRSGRSHTFRRVYAATRPIRLLAATGIRRGECIGLRVEDVDFDYEVALVLGKAPPAGLLVRPTDQPRPGRLGPARCSLATELLLRMSGPRTPTGDCVRNGFRSARTKTRECVAQPHRHSVIVVAYGVSTMYPTP
jgi:hypothetical protein